MEFTELMITVLMMMVSKMGSAIRSGTLHSSDWWTEVVRGFVSRRIEEGFPWTKADDIVNWWNVEGRDLYIDELFKADKETGAMLNVPPRHVELLDNYCTNANIEAILINLVKTRHIQFMTTDFFGDLTFGSPFIDKCDDLDTVADKATKFYAVGRKDYYCWSSYKKLCNCVMSSLLKLER
jgi:hypothetical protein